MQTADEMYEEMLATTAVADIIEGGNMITLRCRTCGYAPDAPTASLDRDALEKLDPRMRLKSLVERASFKCGHRGAWLDMRRDPRAIPKPPQP